MIKNTEKEGNVFFIEVSDMISKEDVESVISEVEEMINQYKKIKFLVFLNDFKGYTVGGFLADFGFYFKYKESFDYMAVVGDKEHEKGMVNLLNKVCHDRAKYFDVSELEQAKEWIRKV